jgi:ribose transport system substrate-binding protein
MVQSFHRGLAAAVILALSGCGGDTSMAPAGKSPSSPSSASSTVEPGKGAAEKPKVRTVAAGTELKLAFICNNASNFWLIAQKGIQQAEKELGVKVNFYQPPNPPTTAKQNEYLDGLITQGYHGVAISPISPEGQTPDLDKAAGRLNLITQDSDAPKSKRLAYVGTNNFEAGRALGKEIVKLLPDGGQIAVFVGTFSADNASQRLKGIEKELEGTKITIVARKEDNKDSVAAVSNVEAVLNSTPDVKLLAGLWSYNAPAIAAALKAKKDTKTIGVGFDEDDETLNAIEAGVLKVTVVQKPYQFGYQSIKLLHDLTTKGESALPKGGVVDPGIEVVNKSNVVEFKKKLDEQRK